MRPKIMDSPAFVLAAFLAIGASLVQTLGATTNSSPTEGPSPGQNAVIRFAPASQEFMVKVRDIDINRVCGAAFQGNPAELGLIERSLRAELERRGSNLHSAREDMIAEALPAAFASARGQIGPQIAELARQTWKPEEVDEADFAARMTELDRAARFYRAYLSEDAVRQLTDNRANLRRHFVEKLGAETVAALLGDSASGDTAAVEAAPRPPALSRGLKPLRLLPAGCKAPRRAPCGP